MRSNWDSGGRSGFTPFSLSSIPVVRGILIAAAVVFVLDFLRQPVASWLQFQSGDVVFRPWTLLTYPVCITHPVILVFYGLWLYTLGGMLERSWGSRNFAALFFAWSAIGAVVFIPVFFLTGGNVNVGLAGLLVPNTAVTVAFAAVDPDLELNFYGLIPVKAKYIALIDIVYLVYIFGKGYGLPMAVLALAAPAAAWFYVRKMPRLNLGFRAPGPAREPRPSRREPLLREDLPPRERVTRNPFQRQNEQREIERLKKLLGEDDDSGPRRSR